MAVNEAEKRVQDRGDGREGFALAAAVLALVLIGALVTGGFYAASQESRISIAGQQADRAFRYAERGVDQVFGTITRSDLDTLPADTTVPLLSGEVDDNGHTVGIYSVSVRRLTARLSFIISEGETVDGSRYDGAKRSIGMMVRTLDANYPMDRALQINDTLRITGNSSIDGADNPPENWEGCTTMATQPGIVASDSSGITQAGSSEVSGDPPIAEDTTMAEHDFENFGDVTYDELVADRDFEFPGGTTLTSIGPAYRDGTCDTAVETNWGAPLDSTDVCHYYFPTVYASGNLKISSSGAGQGILLVDGDLELSGGFQFFGIVIVQGGLKSTGTGSHLNGVVLVAGGAYLETDSTTTKDLSSASGNSIINFSSCAIQRAEEYGSRTRRPVPIARRAWMDLSATGWQGGAS